MATNLISRTCASGGCRPHPIQRTIFQLSVRALRTSKGALKPQVAAATDDLSVKSYEEIPGPAKLPLIGNAWRFLPGIGEYGGVEIDKMSQMIYDKYGPIAKIDGIPGRKDMVFVFTPEDVEMAFRHEGPWPYRDGIQCMEYYRNVLRKDFYQAAGSILTDQGKKWYESRSKVSQPMMQPKTSRRYVSPIADVAQEFVDKMRILRDNKDELPTDFVNELFKWSLESIAYVALDARMGCLEFNLPEGSEPQRLINAVNTVLDKLFVLEFGLPFWKVFPTPSWKQFVKAQDVFLEVSVKYVQAAIDRTEKRKAEGREETHEKSVLERLLETADLKTASIMAQDMLFGGIDTTSYSTAVAMYVLSKNQDKQELLFQELKRFLPTKDSPITEEKLEQMKFLKACFKECMRMKPIVSANMRQTVKEIVLSNYRVPERVNVIMPNIRFRENDDIYPLSKRFIPERWLKSRPTESTTGNVKDYDSTANAKRQAFAFLPFGFGPRTCVGRRFAELEMEVLLAKVIRNFRVEYNYGEMRFMSKMLNTTKDPLKFKLIERNE